MELNNPSFVPTLKVGDFGKADLVVAEKSGEAKYTTVEMRIETPRFGVKLVTKMVFVDGEDQPQN